MTEVAPRDRWLFLTPEVEAELPAATAALAAALNEPGGSAAGEAERLERIILHGGYGDWLDYLRGRRALLERYVQRVGPDALAAHVATVLNEQSMLNLTLPGHERAAQVERDLIVELHRRINGPSAR